MLTLQRCRGSATLNGEGHPIKLLPRQPHSASRHQITMALNYVYEHLCFILICFVHPLARCASSCHFSLGKMEEPTGELISVVAVENAPLHLTMSHVLLKRRNHGGRAARGWPVIGRLTDCFLGEQCCMSDEGLPPVLAWWAGEGCQWTGWSRWLAFECKLGAHRVVACGHIYFSILKIIMDSYFLLRPCDSKPL